MDGDGFNGIDNVDGVVIEVYWLSYILFYLLLFDVSLGYKIYVFYAFCVFNVITFVMDCGEVGIFGYLYRS